MAVTCYCESSSMNELKKAAKNGWSKRHPQHPVPRVSRRVSREGVGIIHFGTFYFWCILKTLALQSGNPSTWGCLDCHLNCIKCLVCLQLLFHSKINRVIRLVSYYHFTLASFKDLMIAALILMHSLFEAIV